MGKGKRVNTVGAGLGGRLVNWLFSGGDRGAFLERWWRREHREDRAGAKDTTRASGWEDAH